MQKYAGILKQHLLTFLVSFRHYSERSAVTVKDLLQGIYNFIVGHFHYDQLWILFPYKRGARFFPLIRITTASSVHKHKQIYAYNVGQHNKAVTHTGRY